MVRAKTPASTTPKPAKAETAPIDPVGEGSAADLTPVDPVDPVDPVETAATTSQTATDDAAVDYVDGQAIIALQPADLAAAVAGKLVEFEPNPDLVEAVRRVLAGEFAPASVEAFKPMEMVGDDPLLSLPVQRLPAGTRLGHVALMHLDIGDTSYGPFDTVYVTYEEFGPLRDAQVFAGDWIDGVEQ